MRKLAGFRGFGWATGLWLAVFCGSIALSGFHSSAVAGGASGKPGIIKFIAETAKAAKARHRIAVEYVLDNDTVKRTIDEFAEAFALEAAGLDTPVTTIALQIRDNIEAALLASRAGLTRDVVHKLVEGNLGAFVGVACRPCGGTRLAAGKVAAAVGAAYVEGFLHGQ